MKDIYFRKNFYQSKLDEIAKQISTLDKKIKKLTFIRVLLFFIFLIAFIAIIKGFEMVAGIVLAVSLLIFIFVIRKYNTSTRTRKKYRNLSAIYQNELEPNKDSPLFGNGNQYSNPLHSYTSDLDIFGNNSLFLKLNRTVTVEGEKKLAHSLLSTNKSKVEIEKIREMSIELSGLVDFKEKFLETVFIAPKVDLKNKWSDFETSFHDLSRWKILAMTILSLLTTSAIILSIVKPEYTIEMILMYGLSTFVHHQFKKKVNKTSDYFSKCNAVLQQYKNLVSIIQEEKFKVNGWVELQKQLVEKYDVVNELNQIEKLINLFDTRLNKIWIVSINPIFYWDIFFACKLEKWMQKNNEHFNEWFSIIGEFDKGLSMSIWMFNNPNFAIPEIVENNFCIEAKALGHPLLNVETMVSNDYQINGNGHFDILTGSNMAGKSTFLRAIGVNMVLALNGYVVCASKFKISAKAILLTYMRVSDSLADNTSTFRAELNRVKSIIEFVEHNDNCFLLLDELLKGTNSADQQAGIMALTRQLIDEKASGVLATHDLTITQLEDEFPKVVRNFNFSVKTIKNDLSFDYKLNEGICNNFNASILMKKIGIKFREL